MKNFSPNLVILVVVLFLVGASIAIFLNRQNQPASVLNNQSVNPEESESPTLAASAEYSATDSSDIEYIESYNSEANASPMPSPASLSQYIYPGTDVISNSSAKIEMESRESSAKITDWYKEKIRSAGFNAKSFTQTNTNGVVLNKLSAAKPGEKIEVTIKKDQTQSNVAITVDRP